MNSAKLYVGNLSYETSEASIRTLFEPHGQVNSVNLITDRDTGRAKGFGFVEMSTPEEAQKAVTELDGTQLDGRALKVNEAKPQVPRESRSGGGGSYGGGGEQLRRQRWWRWLQRRRRPPLVRVASHAH